MNKKLVRVALVIALSVLITVSTTDAYTIVKDDTTHYDAYYYWASIFAFNYITFDTSYGQINFRGACAWANTHYGVFYMAGKFVPTSDGRVHCEATFDMSYKLIAGPVVGGYARFEVNLILLSSSYNPIGDSGCLYYKQASCTVEDQYDYESETPTKTVSCYWTNSLQSGTTYYAAVEIEVWLFNGGYAYSAAGSLGYPTQLQLDVSEIQLYT